MNKNILMIAYHFPPVKTSSGIQRTLKFCQYLPRLGWHPVVLSIDTRAYETTSQEQMGEIGNDVTVKRPFALDSARHSSIFGRYPRLLALPDRWASWFVGRGLSGLQIIKRNKPRIVWSTYPIATAHLIGYALHRLSGLPWIADMRDPMAHDGYPEDPLQWKASSWIEGKIARHASAICFSSPGAIEDFIAKHRGVADPAKLFLIENGHDEECFAKAEQNAPPPENARMVLLHSGVIYPSERTPRPLLEAL